MRPWRDLETASKMLILTGLLSSIVFVTLIVVEESGWRWVRCCSAHIRSSHEWYQPQRRCDCLSPEWNDGCESCFLHVSSASINVTGVQTANSICSVTQPTLHVQLFSPWRNKLSVLSQFPFVSLSHLVFSLFSILFVSLPPSASKRQWPPRVSFLPFFLHLSLPVILSLFVCLCPVTFCLRDFIVGSQKHQVKMTQNAKLPYEDCLYLNIAYVLVVFKGKSHVPAACPTCTGYSDILSILTLSGKGASLTT